MYGVKTRMNERTAVAAMSEQIAADLRQRIASGAIPPGDTLPTAEETQRAYSTTRRQVQTAYRKLRADGLVISRSRRGTVVRDPSTERITRSRTVYRDELGYYFDRTGQPYRPVTRPTVAQSTASRDVAYRLGIGPDTPVTVRDRVLGIPGTHTSRANPLQVATSWLPGWLVDELPVLAEADTGPGGIYDRVEEWTSGPLTWRESVTAALSDQTVAKQLR